MIFFQNLSFRVIRWQNTVHTINMHPPDEPPDQQPDEQPDEPHEAYGLPAIYSYSYCSRAAPGVGTAEVERIIATARLHNARFGITGMLVFGSGVFFQWLEGPRTSITRLVQRLSVDPRHDTVIALDQSEEVRERLFPEWDMELVSATDIREVLVDAIDNASEGSNTPGLQRLLAMVDSGDLQV
jgi:hypothetical protein